MAVLTSAGLAGLVSVADPQRAEACGCFTPPDPTVPIVQAGERIVFGKKNGIVEAHIQVQYSGPAAEFGWLLPLPSEPSLELGVDELFSQLIATTQPKYRLNRQYNGICPFDPNNPNNFGGGAAPSSDSEGTRDEDGDLVVVQDSIGPYDYAVLRADSQQPMLDWLAANRYFVPTATAEAVTPYIHQGAFFLALKLRKGNDIGDLQPVVVKYASDLPMIPIVLTGVGATEDMPVLVWMLGEGRAIPRNFHHTLVNDAAVDWLTAGQNYLDVINRAVDEAPNHHSFVTEYAGTSDIMKGVLDWEGRFGTEAELAAILNAQDFMNYLSYRGFAVNGSAAPPFFTPQFSSQVLAILQRHLPVPARVLEQGVTPTDYYLQIDYWANWYRSTYPTQTDLDVEFDPAVVAGELHERVVRPTLAAGRLFQENPKLTRLYSTLSPLEMTRDPVFSFNRDLPDVSNVRTGTLEFHCGFVGTGDGDITKVAATIRTENGWSLRLPNGTGENPWLEVTMPASWKTQNLREEGQPETISDNTAAIAAAIDGVGNSDSGGCAVVTGARTASAAGAIGLIGLAIFAGALRRRRK